MSVPANPQYEVFALRYARHEGRRSGENYLGEDPHHDIDMPLDFYLWLIRGHGQTILVDTGFTEETARKRRRIYLHDPLDLLRDLGVAPEEIGQIVITHMHYDHAGNIGAFPNATIHIQESEIAYCTGRCMCHSTLRKPFDPEDVTTVIRRLYADKVKFAAGDAQIAPGVSVHHLGGHTAGLQVVRVATARGHVVLASDAAHYWDNLRSRRPFPIVQDVSLMLDAHAAIEQLADGPDHIIPGHDPAVGEIFPRWNGQRDIFALHETAHSAQEPAERELAFSGDDLDRKRP